jgi:hypothetical protein
MASAIDGQAAAQRSAVALSLIAGFQIMRQTGSHRRLVKLVRLTPNPTLSNFAAPGPLPPGCSKIITVDPIGSSHALPGKDYYRGLLSIDAHST